MQISLFSQWAWIETTETAGYEPSAAMYSLLTFNSILGNGDQIYPVVPPDDRTFSAISGMKDYLPFIHPSFNNKPENSRLFYLRRKEIKAGEIVFDGTASDEEDIPLTLLPDQDLIYLSFETTNDFSVSDLLQIRKYYPKAFIYVDVQALADRLFAMKKEGSGDIHNELTGLFQAADAVQLNQREMQLLFLAAGTTEKGVLKKALSDGSTRMVIITKGSRGGVVWERVLSQIQSTIFKPATISADENSYGCGHIFGPAFASMLIKTQSVRSSFQKAANLAALAASKRGFSAKAEHIRINGALL